MVYAAWQVVCRLFEGSDRGKCVKMLVASRKKQEKGLVNVGEGMWCHLLEWVKCGEFASRGQQQ